MAWKYAPVRVRADDYVLSLDKYVILWRMPPSVNAWLEDGDSLLIAEDVRACHGRFARLCPPEPRNSGIVGLPPFFDPEPIVRDLLETTVVRLLAETDEQGLQVALVTSREHRVVAMDEISISGYFRPHMLELGSRGANFVGVLCFSPRHAASDVVASCDPEHTAYSNSVPPACRGSLLSEGKTVSL